MIHWINKATIYHIFIDRFAGYRVDAQPEKPEFCGGNLKGVTDKISYFKDLGVNTLWISPFYKTSAYHGYHITDFDQVDSRFGSKNNLIQLIEKCHENGLRIIADIVPNHCSDQHRWFIEAQQNKQSKYHNWFYFRSWPDDYLQFLGFSVLPKLNLENSETSAYMVNSLMDWAKLGFDGFRIDHVLGIPEAFLKQLSKEVKNLNPEFVLIGEAWGDGMKYKYLPTLRLKGRYKIWKNGFKQTDLQKAYVGILDGVLDFGWRDMLIESLKQNKPFSKLHFKHYNKQYPSDFILPRFPDNHDTSRIMYDCRQDAELFRQTLKILFAQNNFPIVLYHGTEYGLTHNHEVSPDTGFSDLQARALIPWDTTPVYFQEIKQLILKKDIV
ncbi:MAG: hypothetical protein JXA77_04535 [Bacteroidales bacterium]|nr:hypothetical protein [Bacteroidales bacterium]MBN2820766.1 hypothetical protein [Bacteroidales bacterium]